MARGLIQRFQQGPLPRMDLAVLLLEADPDDAAWLTGLLSQSERFNCAVQWRREVDAALECAGRGDIDAVLVAVAQPDGAAIAALRGLREAAPAAPVVVLTDFAAHLFADQTLVEEAQDCVAKSSLDVKSLDETLDHARIRHHIRSKSREELWAAGVLFGDFLSIVNNSADAIVVIDAEGEMRFLNPAAEALLGVGHSDQGGGAFPFPTAIDDVVEVDIETPGGVRRAEIKVVETGWKGAAARLAIIRDITARRELESRLVQARKLEAVGQLAAGIAHEINTPVQFISDNTRFLSDAFARMDALIGAYRGWVAEAREGDSVEALRAEFARAESEAGLGELLAEIPGAIDDSLQGLGEVARLVRAMKVFAHPDAREKTQADLNLSVESTLAISRNEWKSVADVVAELDPALPLVSCFPGDVNQVLLNLIVNAAQAIAERGGQGKGLITVSTRRDGGWAEIAVTDDGCGIPADVQASVFDPFFTTKGVGHGTGQGLAIARSVIVDEHGGSIDFDSTPGQGTTFFVRIPIDAAQGAEAAG